MQVCLVDKIAPSGIDFKGYIFVILLGIVKLLSVEVIPIYITANNEWVSSSPYPVKTVASNSYLEKYAMNHRVELIFVSQFFFFFQTVCVCVLIIRFSL